MSVKATLGLVIPQTTADRGFAIGHDEEDTKY